jgi:fumarate reductase iron-sulfur subunit
MRLRLPAALALPAATKGDFGPSRLQGRRAGRLHHCDASAQGSQRWIFRFRRATPASFWRRPVLATLAAMRAGTRSQRKRAKQQQEATKESMSDPRSELTVSLWRGAQEGRYETYKVPWRDNQTVLDVVTFVQRHLDPTLSYRFACRVGMCGSCAMTVNGTPRWTCRTHVSSVAKGGRLEIGPLENLPVIKDLAADMRPFFDKWQRAKGAFVPSQTRGDEIERIRPDSAARIAADVAIECINCGICYAACDTVRWNSDYLGPAALNRAWTLVNDVRDGANAERLQAVAASGGCHACHSHQSCQELCPQRLNPTASIAGLKRRTMWAYLKGEI